MARRSSVAVGILCERVRSRRSPAVGRLYLDHREAERRKSLGSLESGGECPDLCRTRRLNEPHLKGTAGQAEVFTGDRVRKEDLPLEEVCEEDGRPRSGRELTVYTRSKSLEEMGLHERPGRFSRGV